MQFSTRSEDGGNGRGPDWKAGLGWVRDLGFGGAGRWLRGQDGAVVGIWADGLRSVEGVKFVGRSGQWEKKSIRDLGILGSGKRMWMGLGSVAAGN